MHRIAMRRRLLDDHRVGGHHLADDLHHERAGDRIARLWHGSGRAPCRLAVGLPDAAEQLGDATPERREDRGADGSERRRVGVVGEEEDRRAARDDLAL